MLTTEGRVEIILYGGRERDSLRDKLQMKSALIPPIIDNAKKETEINKKRIVRAITALVP